jgi:hypothetical protein
MERRHGRLRRFDLRGDKLQNQPALPTVQVVMMLAPNHGWLVPNTAVAEIVARRDTGLNQKLHSTINGHVADSG